VKAQIGLDDDSGLVCTSNNAIVSFSGQPASNIMALKYVKSIAPVGRSKGPLGPFMRW
jgi:hypothetical protein